MFTRPHGSNDIQVLTLLLKYLTYMVQSQTPLISTFLLLLIFGQSCPPMQELKQLPMHPQVLDKDSCVNESYCKTCDDEGHRIGEVWQTDPCTTCQCTDRGSTCSTKTCPHQLLCEEGYSLEEVSAFPSTRVLGNCHHYLEVVTHDSSFNIKV